MMTPMMTPQHPMTTPAGHPTPSYNPTPRQPHTPAWPGATPRATPRTPSHPPPQRAMGPAAGTDWAKAAEMWAKARPSKSTPRSSPAVHRTSPMQTGDSTPLFDERWPNVLWIYFLIFHEQRIQDIKLLYNRCTVQRAFSLEITTSANSLTEWLYHLRHHHCYHEEDILCIWLYSYICRYRRQFVIIIILVLYKECHVCWQRFIAVFVQMRSLWREHGFNDPFVQRMYI